MVFIDGDLIPSTSGQASLGVNSSGPSAFDITSIRPFNHVHLTSGVWHDPLYGQSGVIRFNQQAGAFQISVDGGLSFSNISAGGVSNIGVIGGANLTGSVDLASQSSGFLAIFDTAGASPISFAVDHLGLSGLWRFPPQGFNGKIVNAVSQTFSSVTGVTVVHNFGTTATIIQVRDANELVIIPDSIDASNSNQVVVSFNTTRSGRVIVYGF